MATMDQPCGEWDNSNIMLKKEVQKAQSDKTSNKNITKIETVLKTSTPYFTTFLQYIYIYILMY